MSQLDGPLKRVERAKFHLDYLNAEIEQFLESDPFPITQEPNPKRGGWDFRIYIKAEIPDSFGLIFGDFVHNLRASLDNLVWELATRNRGHLKFPIYTESPTPPEEFAPLLRDSISSDAFKIIERVQPYHAKDGSDRRTLLPLLNKFWNDDKHRTTTPTVLANYLASSPASYGDVPMFEAYFGEIDDGKVVGWVPESAGVSFRPNFPIFIRFRKKPIVITDSLTGFYEFVREDIFGAFQHLK